MTNRNGYIRGKCFKPHRLDDDRVANTVKTTAGSRPEDNYVVGIGKDAIIMPRKYKKDM